MLEPADRPLGELTQTERRWLHDKYERLADQEGKLADTRTSYFAAIEAALVAGTVLLVINVLAKPPVFATTATLLSLFGVAISTVWAFVLHRTTAALSLWRDAALALERLAPPVPAVLFAEVSLRRGRTVRVDLSRPYHAHVARFGAPGVPWTDRIRPSELASDVPVLLAAAWIVALVAVWAWFLAVP